MKRARSTLTYIIYIYIDGTKVFGSLSNLNHTFTSNNNDPHAAVELAQLIGCHGQHMWQNSEALKIFRS